MKKKQEKQEIKFYTYNLYYGSEYTMDDFLDIFHQVTEMLKENPIYKHLEPTHFKIQFEEDNYDGLTLRMNIYRMETDEEFNLRLKVEKEYKRDRKIAAAKRKEEIEAKMKLLEDPEYQKLLELQQKFKEVL